MAGRPEHPNQGLLRRSHTPLLFFGALYALLVVLLTIPFFQTHTIYLHAVKLPLFASFNTPEKHGLAPSKTLNLKLTTSDNLTIGAWFILSDPFYHSLPFPPPPSVLEESVPLALKSHPTILFFHGNAATRAVPLRISYYKGFSSHLGANVLAIDYRGFADSQGTPSEAGLALDARAAWDWVIDKGAKPEDVLLVGHSLGTGVVSALSAKLSLENVRFRGAVLMSPFSSVRSLLDTYMIFKVLPLMRPLAMIPGASNLITWALHHKFDTQSLIRDIKSPILIIHAENDWEIPISHSLSLFDFLLDPFLPPLPPLSKTPSVDEQNVRAKLVETRKGLREQLVVTEDIPHFGKKFEIIAGVERRVVLLATLQGGHNRIGALEGVQDVIGNVFGFK